MSLLATHVGSLPRSQAVVDHLFARERGEVFDQKAFDACMAEAVMDLVGRQKSAMPPMSKIATLALTATARATPPLI